MQKSFSNRNRSQAEIGLNGNHSVYIHLLYLFLCVCSISVRTITRIDTVQLLVNNFCFRFFKVFLWAPYSSLAGVHWALPWMLRNWSHATVSLLARVWILLLFKHVYAFVFKTKRDGLDRQTDRQWKFNESATTHSWAPYQSLFQTFDLCLDTSPLPPSISV